MIRVCTNSFTFLLRKNFWRGISTDTPHPLRSRKPKSTRTEVKHFVDAKTVRAVAGSGGDGCISLLQVWANDKAGPDGGDGGNGGHVLLQASSNIKDLNHVRTELKGEDGEKGYNKDCHGKNAPHTVIKVPIGTVVKSKTGNHLGDLDKEGAIFVLARGGAGGKGNSFFVSDTQQTPLIAECGATGEDISYHLEIKSMAHFGLVGLPNAGKSTLLQAVSRARPKIAPYPFTTLKPYVGIVQYSDYEQIAVADLPGLIEGSHRNRGLGFQFLKHLERCSCLLYIVDCSNEPITALNVLKNELKLYNPTLPERPFLIIANKMDLPESKEGLKELEQSEGSEKVLAISAKHGTNVTNLLMALRQLYDNNLSKSNKKDC